VVTAAWMPMTPAAPRIVILKVCRGETCDIGLSVLLRENVKKLQEGVLGSTPAQVRRLAEMFAGRPSPSNSVARGR